MGYTALVVDANPQALAATAQVLAGAGYLVSSASSFAAARRQLAAVRPDVLVTAVRLGGFSGLQLAIASRAQLPDLVAVVTHGAADNVLQGDAAAHGALYLATPIDPKLLVDLIAQSLEARAPRPTLRVARRWPRKRLIAPVAAIFEAQRGLVVDLSYGGVQLRLGEPASESTGAQSVLIDGAAALDLRARRVWSRSVRSEGTWCGLELEARNATAKHAWQAFVDAVA